MSHARSVETRSEGANVFKTKYFMDQTNERYFIHQQEGRDSAFSFLSALSLSSLKTFFNTVLLAGKCPKCFENCIRRRCPKQPKSYCFDCYSTLKGSMQEHKETCYAKIRTNFNFWNRAGLCGHCLQLHQNRS